MNNNQNNLKAELPQLNYLYFYLTEGCNLACRHCWLSPKFDENGKKHNTLPLETFITAIQEAKPLGLNRVKLTGGEPLLHPLFIKLLEIIKREGLSLIIETNGLLLSSDIAAKIAKVPNRFVSVSLDGAMSQTHDLIRGVKGAFDKTIRGVKNLVRENTPPQIIMSVMRCNVEEVVPLIRLAEDLGASSVKFNLIQPIARGKTIHDWSDTLGVSELIDLGRHVDMDLAPTAKIKLFFDYPLAFSPLSRISNGDGCGVCGVHNILGVIHSGQYALCGIGNHLESLTFGNVGKDHLEDVWKNNPFLKELRNGLPEKLNGVCGKCIIKKSCLGSCVAMNFYRKGSFWEPFWFCEQAEKEGLFPKTRLMPTDD